MEIMKREILFHGKRVDNEEFIEGLLCYGFECDDGYAYIMPKCLYGKHHDKGGTSWGPFIKVIQTTVGQFTGLNDSTSKRIFENHVVKAVKRSTGEIIIGTVCMPKSCWVIQQITDAGVKRWHRTAQFSKLTIIGTVHDKQ